MRDVLQILGVGGELAEELPVAFDVAKLFLGDVLLFARPGQGVLLEDASDGIVAARKVEFMLEALGAEAGLLAESDNDALQTGGGLMRAMVRAAGAFGQRRRLAGGMATSF